MLDKTKNYKIDVSQLNKAERTRLQEELFKMGYRWFVDGQKVTELDKDFLFLYDDMNIAFCEKKYTFDKRNHIYVTAEEIYSKPNLTPSTLSLRDYFAGQALFGLMAMYPLSDVQVAKRAYQYADAMMKERATHSTHKVPPSDSKTEKVYGVVGDTKDAAQPVFHIGDKIRFKSTGTIEKVHYITGGGRFINSVSVEDVELVKEK